MACVDLPCLETVQDAGCRLVGVWNADMVLHFCQDKEKKVSSHTSYSPITESLAPLLCRVSPLYLCLVMHRYVERASSF